MLNRHGLSVLAFALISFTFSAESGAKDLTATQILAKMDKTISGYKDQYMENTMTVTNKKGSKKAYAFTIKQKGIKRLIRFTSGEVKGMATLVLNPSRVFVYLPGYKKVRRVSANSMNQSFAGSDFSSADASSATPWVKMCIAKLLRKDKAHWYVECKPKAEFHMPYSKLVMQVGKKTFFQDGVDYYDNKGKKIKQMRSSDPKDYHGIKRNSVVVMTDLRTGHSTRLDIQDFKVNQGFPNSMFTVRQLQWGM